MTVELYDVSKKYGSIAALDIAQVAAGLAVSIPAYAAYNFLVSRVDDIVLDMERSSAEILSYLSHPARPGVPT